MVIAGSNTWFLSNETQCDPHFMQFLATVLGKPVAGAANTIYYPHTAGV